MITPETPDREGVWAENLKVGACRDGSNDVLEAALRALTPPLADAADDPRNPKPTTATPAFCGPTRSSPSSRSLPACP